MFANHTAHSKQAAVIFGCSGLELTRWEQEFFKEIDPFGFILFTRNCDSPLQLRRLIDSLHACVSCTKAPILIDQEGGRVARLRPPYWPEWPAPARIGALAEHDLVIAQEASWLHARSLARALLELGITVNCAPLADLSIPGSDAVIGDRAYATDATLVGALCRASIDGFLSEGVLPVVKHLPGHGRALLDSHLALPHIETPYALLEETDFSAFRAVADCPWGMTAHIVYTDIDPTAPATQSPLLIEQVIRSSIGFSGLLLSDDLSMQALTGDLATRTVMALRAGCDVVLHCNGDPVEMQSVATVIPRLTNAALERIEKAIEQRKINLAQATSAKAALETVRLSKLLI